MHVIAIAGIGNDSKGDPLVLEALSDRCHRLLRCRRRDAKHNVMIVGLKRYDAGLSQLWNGQDIFIQWLIDDLGCIDIVHADYSGTTEGRLFFVVTGVLAHKHKYKGCLAKREACNSLSFATMKPMKELIIVAHNLRSAHNVGSLLRTAEGLGVRVMLCGYTPYPTLKNDTRLPHLALKISRQINKTALGAEASNIWQHASDILSLIDDYRRQGYSVIALEQTSQSKPLPEHVWATQAVLIVGREVEGLEEEIINLCDGALEIPMFGQKESFNVVQAAAMAMYHWRFG